VFIYFTGSELEVLPDLLYAGSFQHLDVVMIEYHPKTAETKRKLKLSNLEKAIKVLRSIKPEINVVKIDDETHTYGNPKLPKC